MSEVQTDTQAPFVVDRLLRSSATRVCKEGKPSDLDRCLSSLAGHMDGGVEPLTERELNRVQSQVRSILQERYPNREVQFT